MSDRRLGVFLAASNNQPNVIDGLELIEPFYYYDWGDCRVYTTKSIKLGPEKKPEDFVFSTVYLNLPEFRTMSYTQVCVGSFFAKMNEEEQAQFLENYEKISKLLMLEEHLLF